MVLKYTTFVINLDGFIWNWSSVDKDFLEIYKKLVDANKRVIFLTNNSAYSKVNLARKLNEKGLYDIEEDDIFTSLDALIHYFYKNNISTLYPIGEYGMIRELENHNFMISENTNHVVVGIDRTLTYNKLRRACKLLSQGAVLYYLDKAMFWKIRDELYPVTMPVLAYLDACVQKEYEKIFVGKPSTIFKDALLDKYNLYAGTTVFISNNPNDMLLASRIGVDGMLIHEHAPEIAKSLPTDKKPKHLGFDVLSINNLI